MDMYVIIGQKHRKKDMEAKHQELLITQKHTG